ncbi:DoxX family membrane protein [Sphingomonas oligophenolica]|uniref:DoxX family membrane protein n=1 Tax=Sphingomonas oligophenolica TaxID=301154 RepID=A0ABU9XZR5_9SPHN
MNDQSVAAPPSTQSGWIDPDSAPYGVGAIGLGIIGLVFASFALQWQPVPACIAPHGALTIVSGLILILGGIATILRRTATLGAVVLAAWYGLWVVALHLPVFVSAPSVGSLLGLAEIVALTTAGLQLQYVRRLRTGPVLVWVRILFGLCPLVFGISHFVYADFTAKMVPGWIPAPLFWAYATGTAHLAAGLAIVAGLRVRLAATLLATMCGLFVLLLHLPRVIAAPGSQLEWTMMFVAFSITGAAWIMRRSGASR